MRLEKAIERIIGQVAEACHEWGFETIRGHQCKGCDALTITALNQRQMLLFWTYEDGKVVIRPASGYLDSRTEFLKSDKPKEIEAKLLEWFGSGRLICILSPSQYKPDVAFVHKLVRLAKRGMKEFEKKRLEMESEE
jgi:glycerol kinase